MLNKKMKSLRKYPTGFSLPEILTSTDVFDCAMSVASFPAVLIALSPCRIALSSLSVMFVPFVLHKYRNQVSLVPRPAYRSPIDSE
jgi:hypothetical protein